MKVTGGTATAALGHGRWNSQTVLVLGGSVLQWTPTVHQAPRYLGLAGAANFFSLTCQSVPGSLPQVRSTYCRYGALDALGPDRGFLGYEYLVLRSCFFFFFAPEWVGPQQCH